MTENYSTDRSIERIYREVLIAVIATGVISLIPETATAFFVAYGSFLLVSSGSVDGR